MSGTRTSVEILVGINSVIISSEVRSVRNIHFEKFHDETRFVDDCSASWLVNLYRFDRWRELRMVGMTCYSNTVDRILVTLSDTVSFSVLQRTEGSTGGS